jgi:hypothetical protein
MRFFLFLLCAVVGFGALVLGKTGIGVKASAPAARDVAHDINFPEKRASAHPMLAGLWQPPNSQEACKKSYIQFRETSLFVKGSRSGVSARNISSVKVRGNLLDITLQKGPLEVQRTGDRHYSVTRTSAAERAAFVIVTVSVDGNRMQFVDFYAKSADGTVTGGSQDQRDALRDSFNLRRCAV